VLEDIAEIAAEAGRIALSRCGTDYQRWEKEPGHPVCDIDLMVDQFLREQLIALDPEAGWLSEETADESDRIERRRVWVVDPIDGTARLSARPPRLVGVGRLGEDRAIRYGVLAAPARDEIWTAEPAAAPGATASGSASATERAARRAVPPTACRASTATWSWSPSPTASRCASPWSARARPTCWRRCAGAASGTSPRRP
jgi:myo-inositol-1(or 4)-monophosphatase